MKDSLTLTIEWCAFLNNISKYSTNDLEVMRIFIKDELEKRMAESQKIREK